MCLRYSTSTVLSVWWVVFSRLFKLTAARVVERGTNGPLVMRPVQWPSWCLLRAVFQRKLCCASMVSDAVTSSHVPCLHIANQSRDAELGVRERGRSSARPFLLQATKYQYYYNIADYPSWTNRRSSGTCVCVCVCVLSHLFWRQFHGSRRDVSFTFAVYSGTTLCSVFFCPSEPTGVTQEGVNTG